MTGGPGLVSIKRARRRRGRGRAGLMLTESIDLRELTRRHVEAVVKVLGPEAAWPRLGISRTTLYGWLRAWREDDAQARAAKDKQTARIDRLLGKGRLTKGEGE